MKTWALMKDSEDRAMHAGRVQEAAHVQEFVEKANIEKALTKILRKDVILLEQSKGTHAPDSWHDTGTRPLGSSGTTPCDGSLERDTMP